MNRLSEHYRQFDPSRLVFFEGGPQGGQTEAPKKEDKPQKEKMEREKSIEADTRKSLADLKAEVGPSWREKREAKRKFKTLLKELNAKYFDENEMRRAWIKNSTEYYTQAKNFQEDMNYRVSTKLEFMHDHKARPAAFEAYKNEIKATYELYSKIDGDGRSIDQEDLRVINEVSQQVTQMELILTESGEKLDKRLEIIATTEPEKWLEYVKMMGNAIINETVNNAAENEFIKKVREIEPVAHFREAKAVFKDHLQELAKAGAKPTREFLTKFNQDLFKPIMKYEIEVEPKALEMQVRKQIDYLLSGVLVAGREEDRAVVNFMKGDKEVRNQMLANTATREALFKGIALTTKRYPEVFDQYYGTLPDEAKRLRRSPRIAKPTGHDQAAQLQALIILGKQAEAIVGQYNNLPEHAGRQFNQEISQVSIPQEARQTFTALKFKEPTSGQVTYASAMERGGFNTRTLFLYGASGLALLSTITNLAQSYADASGKTTVDKLINAVEQGASNPALWVSGGVLVASNMARRNIDFLKYPWLNQYDKKHANVVYQLGNISERVGKDNKDKFIGSEGEWKLLERLTADQIRELLQAGNELSKEGGRQRITREMLVEKGILDPKKEQDKVIFDTLMEGGRAARTRYLFYQKFFSQDPKPDVSTIKQMTTGKGFISKTSPL